MLNLLALDTSADLCLVVLQTATDVLVRETKGVRSHSEHLLPFIESLLKDAAIQLDDLDGIAFSAGPGSFTGIRLAASMAKTLAFASNKPVIALSSLQVLAESYFLVYADKNEVTVINDARMGDFYVGRYQRAAQGCDAVSADIMIKVADFTDMPKTEIIGDAQHLLEGKAKVLVIDPLPKALLHLAESAFERGDYSSGLDAQPVYLRDKTSWKTISQQKKRKEQPT